MLVSKTRKFVLPDVKPPTPNLKCALRMYSAFIPPNTEKEGGGEVHVISWTEVTLC